jgi:hypothetical protein
VAIVLPKFPRRRSSTGYAAETQPAVKLSLCSDEAVYQAGQALTARWQISRVPSDQIQSLEVSVLWHTEGKGDEDLHVHHFHRITEHQIRRDGISQSHSIACQLPATPLSYRGQLISLCWCVRLRLYLAGGREIVAEQPFYLVSANMHAPCSAAFSADLPSLDDHSSNESLANARRATQLVGHVARI